MKVLFCPATAVHVSPASLVTNTLSAPMLATPTKILVDPFVPLEPESKVTQPMPMISESSPVVSVGSCTYVPTEGKLVMLVQVKPASTDFQSPWPERAPK